jgi:hypothetical protein
MTNIQLIGHSIVLLLISFVLINCSNAPITADHAKEIKSDSHYPNTNHNPQEIKSESRYPIIEIWQELDGSVAIRGKSLYFSLSDDGVVEFDYVLRKRTYTDGPVEFEYEDRQEPITSPRHTKSVEASLERIPLTKISEEEFSRFKSLLENLTKSKDIKQEYKPVGLIFDVVHKLTVILKEDEKIERKIIINNSDLYVMDESLEKKFPSLLVNLIKEIHSMRVKLLEQERSEKS